MNEQKKTLDPMVSGLSARRGVNGLWDEKDDI